MKGLHHLHCLGNHFRVTVEGLVEQTQHCTVYMVKCLGFGVAIGVALYPALSGVVSHWPHSTWIEWYPSTLIRVVAIISLHEVSLAYNLFKHIKVCQGIRGNVDGTG